MAKVKQEPTLPEIEVAIESAKKLVKVLKGFECEGTGVKRGQ